MIRNSPRSDYRALWIVGCIYAALSLWMAIASKGFLEADGITHYLARRFALHQPVHMIGIWNRPLCVILYCVPAAVGGLIGTRATSLLLVLLTVPLVVASARRLGLRRPVLAGLFLLTQPLLFAHSFSELTEVPFALLLAAAFYAYQRRWFGVMAVLIAVSPLGRPEGFGLLLVAAVALVLHRRFQWLLVLPLGLATWCYAGWHLFGEPKTYPWWDWLRQNWPYSPESVYGNGSVLTFIRILPAVVGPIAFGFLVFGIAKLLRFGRRPLGAVTLFFASHRARCRLIVIGLPLGVLIVHSLLWMTGKMASNGEPRYMLVAAPFWAMLAAAGLEQLTRQFNWRRPILLIAIGGLLPLVANRIYPCFPLGIQDDDRVATQVVEWLGQHPAIRQRYPRLCGSEPNLFLQLDLDKLNSTTSGQPTREQTQHPTPGTIVVWDSIYSQFNSSADYVVTQKMMEDGGWRLIWTFLQHPDDPKSRIVAIYLSPEDASGAVTDPDR